MSDKILIIENQAAVRDLLLDSLKRSGRQLMALPHPEDLDVCLRDEMPSVLILDISGREVAAPEELGRIHAVLPELPVVLLASAPSPSTVVAALKAGAVDFLGKPLDVDLLAKSVEAALADSGVGLALKGRSFSFSDSARSYVKSGSPAMGKVYDTAMQVAMSHATTVLLTGESGTGKEVIAHMIHEMSPRQNARLMELNCASIPAELLESELFGHEAGAFTDARVSKPGLFELADGGTIFLDEIGEMSLSLQVKLLRFLEQHRFRRVGGTKEISVDVRIVSATNRDLLEMVTAKAFRQDLYYRLNVVPILLPPLRERREDILPLFAHFRGEFSVQFNRRAGEISEEARRLLLDYNWPGNIRELRNVAERLSLLGDDSAIDADVLAPLLGKKTSAQPPETYPQRLARLLDEPISEEGIDLAAVLSELESRLIEKAYQQADSNQTRAAELLRVGRDKLRYRMKNREQEDA